MLMLVFAAWLQILPGSGRGAPQQMILPALALALNPAAILARLIRAGMVGVMEKDYIRTALAKGLGEVIIIVRHALKNMLIPVVTLMGLQLGVFLGGAVVTETVFAWPGVGRLAIVAIGGRDYPMVQSAVLVLAFVFTLVNLLVDIAYMFLDPRIRYV
jgi:peptide/nickel transport system permease protein